jgi:hypothetical protein
MASLHRPLSCRCGSMPVHLTSDHYKRIDVDHLYFKNSNLFNVEIKHKWKISHLASGDRLQSNLKSTKNII